MPQARNPNPGQKPQTPPVKSVMPMRTSPRTKVPGQPASMPVGSFPQQGQTLGDFVKSGKELLSTVAGPNMISGDMPNIYSKDPVERARAAEALTNAGMGAFGMTVFHGSPHVFDKFDMSKIGTGEGAQSYGHGLYFAENPNVASGYQRGLAPTEVVVGDQVFSPNKMQKSVSGRDPVQMALNEVTGAADGQHQNPFATAKERLTRDMGNMSDPSARQVAKQAIGVIEDWQSKGAKVQGGGALYEADIPDEQVAKMLDWDKPLSEQPAGVRDSLQTYVERLRTEIGTDKKWGKMTDPEYVDSMSGGEIYGYLKAQYGDKGASAVLNHRGIPGIKYLDQGSRPPNIIQKRLQGLLEQYGNPETAVDEFMRGVHQPPAAKAKMRQDLLRELKPPTRNLVVFDTEIIKETKRQGAKGAKGVSERGPDGIVSAKSD